MADFADIIIRPVADQTANKNVASAIVNSANRAVERAQEAYNNAAASYAKAMENAAQAAGTATEKSAKTAATKAGTALEKAGKAYAKSLNQAKKAAKNLGLDVNQVVKATNKASRSARAFSDGFVQTLPVIGKMMTPLSRMAVGFGLVRNAIKTTFDLTFGNVMKITELGVQLRDTFLNAKWFSVPIEQGEKINSILDDVKGKMEATQFAIELKQIGLSPEETERFAHTINVLAAFTGQSKSAIEASLKNAQVTDRQLAVLGKTRIGLEVAMAKAQVAAGGRQLDLNERVRVMINFLGVTEKAADALGNLGKSNPFDVMKMQIKTVWQGIVKDLTPALLAVGKAFVSIAKGTDWFVGKLSNAFSWTKRVIRNASEMFAYGHKLNDEERRRMAALHAEKARLRALDEADTKRRAAIITAFVKNELVKRGFMESDADKQQRALELAAANRRKRLRDQERKEALQETISRMQQARTLLRNVDRASLQALSTSGVRGIGAVIAGMSKAVELARVFSSWLGPKFLEKSEKAREIFENTLEAGRGGLQKLIAGEKQRTNQMRLQLTTSDRLKAEFNIQNQILDQQKSIRQADYILQKSIDVLGRSRLQVSKDMVVTLQALKKTLKEEGEEQLFLLNQRRKLAAIEADQKHALKQIELKKMQVTQADELRRKLEQNMRLEGQIVREVGDQARFREMMVSLEVASLKRKLDASKKKVASLIDVKEQLETQKRLNAMIAARSKIREALKDEAKIREKLAILAEFELTLNRRKASIQRSGAETKQLRDLANLRASLFGAPQIGPSEGQRQDLVTQIELAKLDLSIMKERLAYTKDEGIAQARRDQIQHQIAMIALREKELKLLKSTAELEKFKASYTGQIVLQQAENASQMIGQLFSDIVAEPQKALDNLGKAILSSFGDMAFKIGSFFAAQALGFWFTPGGQGNAAGLTAAAAGMYAIGGLLKGAGALIGAKPSKPAAASTRRERVPGTKTPEKGERSINITNYYNDVPWRKGNYSPEQNYRDMVRWDERMQRSTGARRGGARP